MTTTSAEVHSRWKTVPFVAVKVLPHCLQMNLWSLREWIPVFSWPVWPLAGHARLEQNTTVGCLLALRGSVPRGVCLDRRLHYQAHLTVRATAMSNNGSTYVIITPAHNEAEFIAKTIASVVSQTRLPMKWVIVNDGSTDNTRQVVESYLPQYSFVQLINLERDEGRTFARKVTAFLRGLEAVCALDYAFIGNLDADVSFDANYFKRILAELETNPRLGIAGGTIYTKIGDKFITADETLDSVAGAVQLFRRSCFEEAGGYPPMEQGGEDAAIEIIARMKGWTVRKFPDNPVYEERRTGSANAGPVLTRVREGRRFYSLGYGTGFYLLRCLRRFKDRPVLLGSLAALLGYFESLIRRRPYALPPEVVSYLRAEQRKKLTAVFVSAFGRTQ